MKMIITVLAALLIVQLGSVQAMAQTGADKAASCSTYARNRADAEASSGGGALRGGVRGAAKGALFGALVGDSSKSARRGAALMGGLGAIKGGVEKSQNREALYQYYFDACMRGQM